VIINFDSCEKVSATPGGFRATNKLKKTGNTGEDKTDKHFFELTTASESWPLEQFPSQKQAIRPGS
jgi:hypothetical protein